MFEYIWILLPIGLIVGWYAAKLDSSRKRKLYQYLNLRYLLDKEQDKSSKTYDNNVLLNIEDESVSFTLSLGDAHRRRGDVNKAIEFHKYLLESLSNDDPARINILVSLSKDYSAAGLLDRSEMILRLLLNTDQHDYAALNLATLYKQQNDWLQAVSMYELITNYQELYTTEIAHLYCELAEQSLTAHDINKAIFWADRALSTSINNARTSLIKAYIFLNLKEYRKVIKQCSFIEQQQPSLLPLVIPIVIHCTSYLEDINFTSWIDNAIQRHPSFFYLKIWKTHWLTVKNSVQEAIFYISKELEITKNLQGITLLNQLQIIQSGSNKNIFNIYKKTFDEAIDYYAQFRCEKCGFISKTLQWHCPSCQSWNTVAPVSDIIALQKS